MEDDGAAVYLIYQVTIPNEKVMLLNVANWICKIKSLIRYVEKKVYEKNKGIELLDI